MLGKLVLIFSLFTSFLFADNSSMEIKNLKQLEKHLPAVYETVKDYFNAKTCSKDFTKKTSFSEVQNFIASATTFGTLTALKALNRDEVYSHILHNYKAMNCNNIVLDINTFYKAKNHIE